MSEENCEGGGDLHAGRIEEPARDENRENRLAHVEEEDDDGGGLAGGSEDVGHAYLAAAVVADVHVGYQPAGYEAERHRAEQVGERHQNQVVNHVRLLPLNLILRGLPRKS